MNTTFVGLKLKNPIILSAGPWSRDGLSIKRALEAGAGAVITCDVEPYSIIVGNLPRKVRPRFDDTSLRQHREVLALRMGQSHTSER